jgi:transposase
MRFVAVKTEEQQAVLMWHRARTLVVANRNAQVNQIRGLLGEFGLVVPRGVARLRRELPQLLQDAENDLPKLARTLLSDLLGQRFFEEHIQHYEQQIHQFAHQSEAVRRLMVIEGIGPITATALVASVGDARVFESGRQFAAWLGLTPRQHSSGGKIRLGQISKRGDRYLRTLLVHGSRALLRYVGRKSDAKSAWAVRMMQRRHLNVTAVALAAKQARIIWAMLAKGTPYRPPVVAAAAV